IPDYDEQIEFFKRISETETESNILSTELTYQLDLVKQLRQAFLREAMQGKLVPQNPNDEPASVLLEKIKAEKERLIKEKKIKKQKPLPPITEDETPFTIPENWVWCRLGELCNTITKGSSPKWQGVNYVDSYEKGILFITSKNVDSFKIDLSDSSFVEAKFNEIEPRSILQKGDLLTNIVGASIGRTALFDLDFVANINQAVCILRIEHEFIDKPYLLNLMNSEFVINLMLEMQFAPGRANLSMSNLANFPIPLPPLTEQQRIVTKLDELMQYCDELEASIKESQQQNELLLQQVLREALEPKEKEVERV
ncbi:MAG: restriction endonuclease subunit S, partial [Bacteroidetes bacterium]|nr:restriction endonuclease subunit S [Bacteroidota bacterium]